MHFEYTGQAVVILTLMEDENYCYIQFMRSPDGDVTNYELQLLGQYIQNAYTKAKVELLGLTEEQIKFFDTSVVSSAGIVDTKSDLMIEDTSISEGEYWFIYGMMFVVLMVCILASTTVATSIVQEKSSKVIEYLLTSVRPLAIIVGKVFAMLVTVMIQLIALVLANISGVIYRVITLVLSPVIRPPILVETKPASTRAIS